MLIMAILLPGYLLGIPVSLWLQAINYKDEGLEFDSFNILFAFLPFSFVAPLICVVSRRVSAGGDFPKRAQKLLTPK